MPTHLLTCYLNGFGGEDYGGSYSREQHGVSLGHFLVKEHDGRSWAMTEVAPSMATARVGIKRTILLVSAVEVGNY